MMRQMLLRFPLFLMVALGLSACSSGGGDGSRNAKPTIRVVAAANNFLEGEVIELTGTGTDSDGTIISYEWQRVSGPDYQEISVADGQFIIRVLDVDEFATLIIKARVFDDNGTSSDWVSQSIIIRPASGMSVKPPADIDGTFVVTDSHGNTLNLSQRVQEEFEQRYAELAPFSLTLTTHPEKMSCWLTETQGEFGTEDLLSEILCNRVPEVSELSSVAVQFGAPVVISPVITDQDNEQLSFTWSQVNGHTVEIENPQSQSLEFTAPMLANQETLGFNLLVSDGVNDPLVLPLEVTVLPPLTMGFNVSGLTGELVVENQSNEQITVDENGLHLFSSQFRVGENYALAIVSAPATQDCRISDSSGVFLGEEQVFPHVSCNTYPQVALTAPDVALQGDTLAFSAQAIDADSDAVSYLWSHVVSGNQEAWTFAPDNDDDFSSVNVVVPAISQDEVVLIRLTATDARGAVTVVEHTVAVRTSNELRVAVSADVSGLVVINDAGESLNIDATGDFGFAEDYARGQGYSLSIEQQPDGADCQFEVNGAESIAVADRADAQISYRQVMACNLHPTIDVQNQLYAQFGETVDLSAQLDDPDGDIASIQWSTDDDVEITNAQSADAQFIAPLSGASVTLSFTLSVTDNGGATVTDEVVVEVAAALRLSFLPNNVDVPVIIDIHDNEALVESVTIGSETATTNTAFTEGAELHLSLRDVPEDENCNLSVSAVVVSGDTDQMLLFCDSRPVIVLDEEIEVTEGIEFVIAVEVQDDGPDDAVVEFKGIEGSVVEVSPGQYEITTIMGGATADTEVLTVEVTSGEFFETSSLTINAIPGGRIGYPTFIPNAQIELYPLAGPFDQPVCTRVSSSFEGATSNGLIPSMTDCVERGKWYLVAGLGGNSPSTGNRVSDLHAVIPGDWLLDHQRWFINHLTELAYQRVAYLIAAGYPEQTILSYLDEFANNIVHEDLNLDGLIDYLDILLNTYIPQSALNVSANSLQDIGELVGQNQLGNAEWIDLLHAPLSSLPIDNVEDVDIVGTRAYVLTHDETTSPQSTVWVYDLSDPLNPAFEVSYHPTDAETSMVVYTDGTIIVGDHTDAEIVGPQASSSYTGYDCDWGVTGGAQRAVRHENQYYIACDDGGLVDLRQPDQPLIALDSMVGMAWRFVSAGDILVALDQGDLFAYDIDRATFTAELLDTTESSFNDIVKTDNGIYVISQTKLFVVTMSNNQFVITELLEKSIEDDWFGSLQVVNVDGVEQFFIDDRKYVYNNSGQLVKFGSIKEPRSARIVMLDGGAQVNVYDNPQINFDIDIIELQRPYLLLADALDDTPLAHSHTDINIINDHLFAWQNDLTNFHINDSGYSENWTEDFTAYQDNCALEKDDQLYRIHDTGLNIFDAPTGLSSNPVSTVASVGACPAALSNDAAYWLTGDASVSWIRAVNIATWEKNWDFRIRESGCSGVYFHGTELYATCGSDLLLLDPDFVEDIEFSFSKQFIPQQTHLVTGNTANLVFWDNAAYFATQDGTLNTIDFDGVNYEQDMPCEDANVLRHDGDRLYVMCDNGYAFRFRMSNNGAHLEYSIDLPSKTVKAVDFTDGEIFLGDGHAIYRYEQPEVLLP